MKLGMNMLLWSTDVTGPEYLPVFEMLRDAGYEGVEIPIFDRAVDAYARLGEQLDALGLEALGVGARGGDDSPISPDPAVRERGLQATKAPSTLRRARRDDDLRPTRRAARRLHGRRPDGRGAAARGREPAARPRRAATRDVTIVVEYLNRFEMYLINCAADAAALVREVDHPNCRMMYDTFHAHIEEKDPRAALQRMRGRARPLPRSENDRGTPGRGQVAWDETFAALRRSATTAGS